jgi:hypothetical protein
MGQSPRLALVDSSVVTDITIQDIVDTIRDYEQKIDQVDDPHMLDGYGKQPLGGLESVGLTVVCRDVKWAFSAHTTPDSIGSATSSDPGGRILYDSGGTFESDGIVPGAIVWNDTDGSSTTVLRVDSENQIIHWPLVGGAENDWDISDSYRIWNVRECTIKGGNLTAIDAVGAEMHPILSTFATQVSYTASSSATLVEQAALEHSVFADTVMVDTTSSWSGTSYPVGTGLKPVNNMADALLIAVERGIKTFWIRNGLTLTSQDYSDGFIFMGDAQTLTSITINAGANVTNCKFEQCNIQGTLDGNNHLEYCSIGDLDYVSGMLYGCGLDGTITLGGGVVASFIDCYSNVTGMGTPTIDLGGSGQQLNLRNYNGGIELINKTGSEVANIDINSGTVKLASSLTAGTTVLRGLGTIEDNSGPGCTVVSDGFVPEAIQVDLSRLLGLSHENSFLDNTSYDVTNPSQLLSGRLRIFDSRTNAEAATDGGSETTGLIATYLIDAAYEVTGQLASYRMVRSV